MSELNVLLAGEAVDPGFPKFQDVEIPLSLEGMFKSLSMKHLEPSTPEQNLKFVLWKEHSGWGDRRHRGGRGLSWIYQSMLRPPTFFPNLVVETPSDVYIPQERYWKIFLWGSWLGQRGRGGLNNRKIKTGESDIKSCTVKISASLLTVKHTSPVHAAQLCRSF